jgi:TonB-linked SusC/RagA family outer membrane protein
MRPGEQRVLTKIMRVMRLTAFLLTVAFIHAHASVEAQNVTISGRDMSLKQVFTAIKKQTGYVLFNQKGVLADTRPVSLSVRDLPLRNLLEVIFKDQPVEYVIEGKTILISRKLQAAPSKSPAPAPERPIATFVPVNGLIRSATGQPLPGVNIVIQGTNKGTISAANGSFSINANEGDVLKVSAVGFAPISLRFANGNFQLAKEDSPSKLISGNPSSLMIMLASSTSPLDEVQVTAYGTTTKRFNAGNITTITSKDIEKNPVNNVLEALQGKVPGLFIQQVTGQPGGAFTVRMRGSANLFTGATQPMIIVDGVRYPGSTLPLSTNTAYGTQNFLQGGSGLNYINPNDIESIDVLKDVDATAIYGSSGAYGVILITTKRSKAAQQSFNANIYTGVSVNGRTPSLLNTEQYLMLRREALKNDNITGPPTDNDLNGTWPADRYTDWQKEFMGKAAVTTNANLSYSGGAQNVTYLISGSVRDMGNIQRHRGTNRDGSLRFALNTGSANNKFNMALTGTYLSSKNDMVPYDFSVSALTPPNAPPPYNKDGSVNWAAIGSDVNSSGTASNANRLYENRTNNLLANATLTYRPVKKVTLRSIFGYNTIIGKELIGYPTSVFNPSNTQAATQTVGILHQYNTRSFTISPYGEFNTFIGKKGDFSVKLGGEINNRVTYFDDITGTGFPTDALLNNPSVGSSVTTSYNLTEYRSIGMYGILKFVWDNKYIIDINTRRDGSTKFGPGRRIGNFGSAALAWIFSEEKLISDHLPWLSFGKLRVSSGIVGGDAIGDFRYLGTYSVIGGTYDGKVGLGPNSLPNPVLNWERNFNSEAGIELGFLKDRIIMDLSYYQNRAGNQLLEQPLSSVTGYTRYALNSDALIRTSGMEISLNTTNFKTKDFTWSTRFNISLPQSKLLRVPTQSNQNSNYVLNKPVTGILLYKYNGVNPQTGNYSFTDAKGNVSDFTGGLTQADKTEFIDLAPKYFGGLQNSVTYKQLTLDFSFNFTNRMGKNSLGQTVFPFGIYGANGSTMWLRRWQKPGDVTDIPKLSTQLTSYFRQDLLTNSTGAYSRATYARLQNVSIRYNLPAEINKKMHLKNLSVYIQGQNLLTISEFEGLDPENLNAGVIPPLRVFTGGINVTL